MPQQHPLSPELFGRKSIRRALKLWHSSEKLGAHPLAALRAVAASRTAGGQPFADSLAGRGIALRALLREAVHRMKPAGSPPDFADRNWRFFNILHEQFINNRRAMEIRDEMGVSESGYFNDQRQALDHLGDLLRELEEDALAVVAAPAAEADVAFYETPERPLNRLPHQLTAFIGRQKERRQMGELLADQHCRLITVLGPGGAGKTRLAIQAAHDQQALFEDGAYFVALAPLETAEFIAPAIARVVGFNFDNQEDPQVQLLNFLRRKKLLLVLDNFEHLMGGVSLLADILTEAPGVKVLATSRERLNLRGEWLLELGGMRFPEADPPTGDRDIDAAAYSAVQLFLDASQRSGTGPPLTEEDRPAIVRICQLLRGMPLGIELAASWVDLISCREIAAELERSLDFLESSYRDLPERHRSLRAVFNHSWNLLSAAEQAIFQSLAVFRGSFSRDAARQVTGARLPALHALSSKSLLRVRPSGRYAVHSLLRQYAAEKLRMATGQWQAIRDRHSEYYLGFLQQRAAGLRQNGRQNETLDEIEKEFEDIRAAWRWAIEQGRVALIQRSSEPLYLLYSMRHRWREGEEAFGRIVAHWHTQREINPEQRRSLGVALGIQGRFNLELGHHEIAAALFHESLVILHESGQPREKALINCLAIEADLGEPAFSAQLLYEQSLQLFEQIGDEWGVATAHFARVAYLRRATGLQDTVEQRALLDRSLTIRERIGDHWGSAKCLNYMGNIAYETGDYGEAQRYARLALQMHQEVGDRLGVAYSLNHLAQAVGIVGSYEEARTYYRQALSIFQAFGNPRDIAVCYDCVGYMNYLLQDDAAATESYRESLRISQELGDDEGVAWSLHNMGDIARRQGRYEEARRLYAESHELHEKTDPYVWGRVVSLEKLGRTTLLLGESEEAGRLLTQAWGLAVETERFREATDALLGLARIAAGQSDHVRAAIYLLVIVDHQASAKETRDAAAAFLEELNGRLTTAELEEARQWARKRAFRELVD